TVQDDAQATGHWLPDESVQPRGMGEKCRTTCSAEVVQRDLRTVAGAHEASRHAETLSEGSGIQSLGLVLAFALDLARRCSNNGFCGGDGVEASVLARRLPGLLAGPLREDHR